MEGRKVFANILKYVRMGASSNFGNMFSVLGASVFLPFVPMAPLQILTNNLLYDFSQVPIPTDDVDPEQIAAPRPWSMSDITRFILFIGPCSSVFDYTTYFIMLYVFGCWDPARASLFQTGWFVESLLTQTLIIHVIRTNRIPFLQSRASWPLMVTTAGDHARRHLAAVLTARARRSASPRCRTLYWPLARPDAPRLCRAHPGREDLAAPSALDLTEFAEGAPATGEGERMILQDTPL